MTEADMRALIRGLRRDAGDYGRVRQGLHNDDFIASWDARHERAWDAANLIESMLAPVASESDQ